MAFGNVVSIDINESTTILIAPNIYLDKTKNIGLFSRFIPFVGGAFILNEINNCS